MNILDEMKNNAGLNEGYIETIEALQKEHQKLENELKKLKRKLSHPDFKDKMPIKEKIADVEKRKKELWNKMQKMRKDKY